MAERPLKLTLPGNVLFRGLSMKDPLDPLTWTATSRFQRESELTVPREALAFFEDMTRAVQMPLESIFISVSQDADGRHNFVNLGLAGELLKNGSGEQLPLVPESEVKELQEQADVTMLYAQAEKPPVSSRPAVGLIPVRDEWCPHKSIWASNYSVIPELSLGVTQRLILCNEQTLCRCMPEERIFEHLKLIVNCHESRIQEGKYRIGACATDSKPRVVCQAVHQWFALGREDMNRVNDEIQEAMWDSLQQGTVAVHCLAGIHRAACIVACHFLWRYYALGHTDMPSNPQIIYATLQASRPSVEPAYGHVLQNYAIHLQQRHGTGRQ